MDVSILYTHEEIQSRISELAHTIAHDYEGKHIVIIGVLNGAYMFIGDLTRAIWRAGLHDFEIEFVRISSYAAGKETSGEPKLTKDVEIDLTNKHVLVVEDIVESGYTLRFLVDHLQAQNPASIKVCTLLSKSKREVDVEPDYMGFEVNPNDWVEGYGLDTGNSGRGRPDIVKR